MRRDQRIHIVFGGWIDRYSQRDTHTHTHTYGCMHTWAIMVTPHNSFSFGAKLKPWHGGTEIKAVTKKYYGLVQLMAHNS